MLCLPGTERAVACRPATKDERKGLEMKVDALLRGLKPSDTSDLARTLEARGYDGLWSVEAQHNPFMPLTFAASATTRPSLGTNIAVAFARSPFSMAQAVWDLQALSGGRMIIGLGTQVRAHVERRFSMPFDHPAARVTDYIRCMRAIWDSFQNGSRPDYEGPFYRYQLNNPMFNAGPIDHPEVPIHLAGVNPRMCRAGGEVADGFHVHPMHSPGYLRDVVRPSIDEGARMHGRSVDDLELYSPVFVVSGDSEAERAKWEDAVRRQVSMYAATPSYRAVLEYHGCADIAREMSALMRNGELDALARKLPDALLSEVAVFAKPGDLGKVLRERYEGLMHRVALYYTLPEGASESDWQAFVGSLKG
jgi:probable F420-dependent oxidoreductase